MKNKTQILKTFFVFSMIAFLSYVFLTNFLYLKADASGEDVTPPELISYEFSKTTINTEFEDDSVTITAVITDDISGVETGGSSAPTQLRMVPASGIEQGIQKIFSEVPGQEDTYEAVLTFPYGSAIGEWYIESFLLVDKIGNSVSLSTQEVEAKAFPESERIFNEAQKHDITSPVLESFEIVDKTINTENDSDSITINVTITDDMTGVETGGSTAPIQLRLEPVKETSQGISEIFSLVDGEGNEDNYTATIVFPRGSAKGAWRVSSLYLVDKIGNSVSLSFQEVENVAGVGNATITNEATTEDVTPPEIVSFSITPTVFDTTQGDVELTLTIELTDDMAGVAVSPENHAGAGIMTQMSIRPLIGTQSRGFTSIYLETGDYLNGTYTSTLTIPQGSKLGVWEVDSVLAVDYIYNYKYYSKEEIIQKNLGNIFLVNTGISNEVTIDADWTISSDIVEVTFPAGTVVSKEQGGNFGFYRMINQSYTIEEFEDFDTIIEEINNEEEQEEIDVEKIFSTLLECQEEEECFDTELSDEGFEGEPIMVLRAGIPRVNLTFSKPVQIKLKGLQEYNGRNLEVQTFAEGGEIWDDMGSCTIQNGNCVFTTEHASFFGLSLGQSLYQSHTGTDGRIYTRFSPNGINWSHWTREMRNAPGENTRFPVAMASMGGKLYQAHTGTDRKIYTRSSTNGINWTRWTREMSNAPGEATRFPVAMSSMGDTLYQTHAGTDGKVYTRSSKNGVNWTRWTREMRNAPGEATYFPITMTSMGGKLYQTHAGTDRKIYTRYSSNGTTWSRWTRETRNAPGEATYFPVAMTSTQDTLYQSHTGTDGKIYTRSSKNGTTWSRWTREMKNSPGEATKLPVSMSSMGDVLYQTHIGTDKKIYTRSSRNGINWSPWTRERVNAPGEATSLPVPLVAF